jgi:putative Flp pilus-assembly TadE/G-like protein
MVVHGFSGVARSERGAVTVLVAVSMLALLGFLALGIDMGMLYVAHNDAQRAADAAALAGASAFMEQDAALAEPVARARAMDYALRNTFQNGPIDSTEVNIRIVPESSLVGVRVQRDSVPTLFARVFGIRHVPIGAYAAAEAVQAGNARCLKPFAVPDIWNDANGDTNRNRQWDPGETWKFGDDPGDYYSRYSGPGGSPTETGYGSSFRDGFTPYAGDFGRQIKIKVTNPNDVTAPQPGIFLPWQIPLDAAQKPCEGFGLGGGGAAVYRTNICSCNNSPVSLNTPYPIETGNMVGPTWQGTSDLINEDPHAYWDEATQSVKGSTFGNGWLASPRIIKIALFEPGQLLKPGMQTIEFNNFGLMFIEAQQNLKAPVTGRFLYYVSGNGDPGPTTGSLVKTLKLVK